MLKVFIDGQEGTTGLKIYDRLKERSDITLLSIPDEKRKEPEARKEFILKSDLTFLCLPDAAAVQSAEFANGGNTKIIDASTAHRTNETWTYGLPELKGNRGHIVKSSRVCVPGCHAGGAVSLIRPLVEEGMISNDYPFSVTSVTGYSGGGKKMISEYENKKRDLTLSSPGQYALNQKHKHLPEIIKFAQLKNAPAFMPIVADFYSGMCVTVPVHTRFLKGISNPKQVFELFTEYYAGNSIVKVYHRDTSILPANRLAGKDIMEIDIFGSDEHVLLCATFDNLGKGASGAALQCMNIMFGLNEELSLIL